MLRSSAAAVGPGLAHVSVTEDDDGIGDGYGAGKGAAEEGLYDVECEGDPGGNGEPRVDDEGREPYTNQSQSQYGKGLANPRVESSFGLLLWSHTDVKATLQLPSFQVQDHVQHEGTMLPESVTVQEYIGIYMAHGVLQAAAEHVLYVGTNVRHPSAASVIGREETNSQDATESPNAILFPCRS